MHLNGDERRVESGHSVATLLSSLGIHPGVVVVERNREIIRREHFEEVPIREGDKLELVHFVGGG